MTSPGRGKLLLLLPRAHVRPYGGYRNPTSYGLGSRLCSIPAGIHRGGNTTLLCHPYLIAYRECSASHSDF